MSNIIDQLQRLVNLKKGGFLTDNEFTQAKKLILSKIIETESFTRENIDKSKATEISTEISDDTHSHGSTDQLFDKKQDTLTNIQASSRPEKPSRNISDPAYNFMPNSKAFSEPEKIKETTSDPAYKYIPNASKSYVYSTHDINKSSKQPTSTISDEELMSSKQSVKRATSSNLDSLDPDAQQLI